MPDQPHCRWCNAPAGRPVHGPGWFCYPCGRYQDWMACPCCGHGVSVEKVEEYLGHPVKAQEVIDG